MWDLVHRQGIKPGSPALGAESQPLDHQGSSHLSPFKADHRKKVFYHLAALKANGPTAGQ